MGARPSSPAGEVSDGSADPSGETEEYYERFVRGLRAGAPDSNRDDCARLMMERLLALYAEFGIPHPRDSPHTRRFTGVAWDDNAHTQDDEALRP